MPLLPLDPSTPSPCLSLFLDTPPRCRTKHNAVNLNKTEKASFPGHFARGLTNIIDDDDDQHHISTALLHLKHKQTVHHILTYLYQRHPQIPTTIGSG